MKKKPKIEIFLFPREKIKTYLIINLILFFISLSLNVSGSIYSQNMIFNNSVDEITVKDVIRETDANLTYLELENDLIEITPLLENTQQLTVTGLVTDASSGESLPGVSIVIEGTTTGTVTDLDGKFSLPVPNENAVLVFSFVGYSTSRIPLEGRSVLEINLTPAAFDLDEVVVVGYGTLRRVNLTGSVTIVKAEELAQIAVPSLGLGLMGRAPGLFIKNSSGEPGEIGVDLNIRGYGTPLIIVDGTPVDMRYFQNIDPNDIESFNVLKDASAAAVYGARAGNGVIVITTKRGIESAPRFSYDVDYAQQFFTVVPRRVDAAGYTGMWNVMLVHGEDTPPVYTDEAIQKYRDGSDPVNYPNTDWWKETLLDYSPRQRHNLSVRGGTESIKYFTSIGYFNQKGMLRSNDIDFTRFNLRSNLDVKLTEKLDLNFDLSATQQDYISPDSRMTWLNVADEPIAVGIRIWRSRPFAPNTPLPDPNRVPAMLSGLTENPYYMGFRKHSGTRQNRRLTGYGRVALNYDLPYGFGARASFDINRDFYRGKRRVLEMPQYDYNAETGEYILRRKLNPYNFLTESMEITNNFNQQYFLTWDGSFGNHEINALVVHEILTDDFDHFRASRRDYEFEMDYLFAGPDAGKDNYGYATEGGRKSYVGRINYNYLGKYLIELSGRADGSPKFPAETRWGYFPSASIGWRISEESFMEDISNIIWNLKLRASHGVLGFDRAGAFQYLSTFSIRSRMLYDQIPDPGIRADALPNPFITWEKMRITNIGLDFNLGGFLDGTFDYFYRLRSDVLGQRIAAIPSVVGATLPQENYMEFDNRGMEFSLYHRNIIGDVNFTVGGNISYNREKTVFRDQAPFSNREHERRSNEIGEWRDRVWAFPTDGLFTSQAEIDNYMVDLDGQGNRTIRIGDTKWIDTNNDGVINADDMILQGRGSYPKMMYGIDLSVSWKGFDLYTLWQGAGMLDIPISAREFSQPFASFNTPLQWHMDNIYTPENPWIPAVSLEDAKLPRFARGHVNYSRTAADYWIVPGAYIRLKNIQLGYNIPERITTRWGIDRLKIYLAGYDVWTFAAHGLNFLDPEVDTHNPSEGSPQRGTMGSVHPQLGSYNVGLQLNF
jgi:TonB-linked SusC/RagA family outer membrane protein